jgi:hypothetical protein
MPIEIDDEAEPVRWLRIPLDAETAARLEYLSDECHADPVRVAASLLHDVLADDAEAENLPVAIAAGNITIN